MFEEKEILGEDKIIESKKLPKVEKPLIPAKVKPVGPFKIKMEVIKGGKYRLNGKVFELEQGDFFDGEQLSPRKRDILINTKYIIQR